jgi:hypothetical protein
VHGSSASHTAIFIKFKKGLSACHHKLQQLHVTFSLPFLVSLLLKALLDENIGGLQGPSDHLALSELVDL